MKVEIKNLPSSQKEINVEVEPKELSQYLKKAAKKFSQGIKIDGFRPGMAPYNVVERQVGRVQLWEEAASQSLPEFLEKIFIEHKIDAIGRPSITVLKIAPENPFIFKAIVAVMPEINLPDYQKIHLPKPKVKPSQEKDVDNLIQELREMRAEAKTVLREAKIGDRLEINFKGYLENVPQEGAVSENHPLILGKGNFIPGFEDNLVGLKAGQEKEFTIKFPENYHDSKLASKSVRFQVKINLVQEVILPIADDQFVKNLGPQFTNLSDLRAKLKENLKVEMEAKNQEKYELQVLEKISENVDCEIPPVLLNAEKDRMLEELKSDIENKGSKFNDYLLSIKKTDQDLKAGWDGGASRRIKTSLALREVAKREKIKIEKQEIDDEINKIHQSYSDNPELIKYFNTQAYRHYTENLLQNRKVIQFLCGIAQGAKE